MPLGAAQAHERSSAKTLLAPRPRGRGLGRGLLRQRQGRAPRSSPRRGASAALSPAGDDETPPGPSGGAGEPGQGWGGGATAPRQRGGAGGAAGAGRSGAASPPSFRPRSAFSPLPPCGGGAAARRWGRCPRGGAGRAQRGRAEAEGAGLTYSAPAGPSRASR